MRKSERLKVVHVITRLDLGGAQQNTLDTLSAAKKSGFQGILMAGRGGELMAQAPKEPGTFYILSSLQHPIRPWWDFAALVRMYLLFKEIKPDVVHTHSSKAGALGRLAARMSGVPVILHTVHGWSFNPSQSGLVRWTFRNLEKALARFTDGLVFVSNRDKKEIKEWDKGLRPRTWLVRSAINFSQFHPRGRRMGPSDFGFPPQTRLVGCLGNLKPQKDPMCFVRAAEIIAKKDKGVGFVFAGEGPLRPALEAEIRRCGLTSRFCLPGWIQKPEAFLRGLCLYLSSSAFEGLPRSVVQALRCGVPVVATRAGGVAEVVSAGLNGFLAPPGDAPALARQALGLLQAEPKRRQFSKRASTSVGSDFDVRNMVVALAKIYLQLWDERKKGVH